MMLEGRGDSGEGWEAGGRDEEWGFWFSFR